MSEEKFGFALPKGPGRKAAEMNRRLRAESTSRRLASSSVPTGALLVDGGSVTVRAPGQFLSEYASGRVATWLGPIKSTRVDRTGMGIIVQHDGPDIDTQTDIFTAMEHTSGTAEVKIGMGAPDPIESFTAYAGQVYLQATGPTLGAGINPGMFLFSDGVVSMRADADIVIQSLTNNVKIPHTTAGAANAVLDATTGRVTRASSSLRYKRNVQDLPETHLDAFLAMRPVTFEDASSPVDDPDTYAGVIAEELHAAGLGLYVTYIPDPEDPDGDPLPDGVTYDRLIVPAVLVLRDHRHRLEAAEDTITAQQQQITALTEQVAALAARLDALEGGS